MTRKPSDTADGPMLRYAEMADILGESERAVAQQVRRAVRKLWRQSPVLVAYRAEHGLWWDARAPRRTP